MKIVVCKPNLTDAGHPTVPGSASMLLGFVFLVASIQAQ
jgi:hypothetical protein